MIRRDRNHPSILIWSMGNETNQPADSAWARAEDPSRLLYMRRCEAGAAFAGKFIQVTDKNLAIENLLRCTVRGWLNTDDHDFGAPTGRPDGSQVTGTEEWQHYKNFSSDRLLSNNIVTWLYADHGCDREYLNSPLLHINPKGWVDAYRFPKLTYYLWQANYTIRRIGGPGTSGSRTRSGSTPIATKSNFSSTVAASANWRPPMPIFTAWSSRPSPSRAAR
jgi:beta-galactosidase